MPGPALKLGASTAVAVTNGGSASASLTAGGTLYRVSTTTSAGCHFRTGVGAQTATTDDPLVGINAPALVVVPATHNTFAGLVPAGGNAGRLIFTVVSVEEP